jgi:hypothetical protein
MANRNTDINIQLFIGYDNLVVFEWEKNFMITIVYNHKTVASNG